MSKRKRSTRAPAAQTPSAGSVPQQASPRAGQAVAYRPATHQGAGALLARCRQALRAEVWAAPLSIFAGSRLAVFALALLFIGLFPVGADSKPSFLQAFAQWDGGWYTGIAAGGYSWQGPGVQSNVAFFPLYPFLGKLVGLFMGGPRVGLFVVANASFAVYLVYLYRLVSVDFDAGTGLRAILYVAVFPLSFIYSCLYTESTMLALIAAAFYYARRGRWRVAVPLGALASLTRLAGLVVLLPLAWEYYRQKGLQWRGLSLAAVPAGTAAFALYVYRLTGSPLSFTTITSQAWSRHFTWPWDTVRIGLDVVTRVPLASYIASIALVDVATIVLFGLLSLAAIRWLPTSYWLYALPATLLAISSTLSPDAGLPTASLARYLLAVFPAFIVLALAGRNRYVHYLITFACAVLLGPLAIYFFSGIWVC
jgi:hypothetical protein